MNIKNRIKKLENGVDTSGNCQCKDVRKNETYFQDLSEGDQDTTPQLSGDPVPEICLHCRKPIEKEVLIIQLVDATTKEKFPEEWNTYNQR